MKILTTLNELFDKGRWEKYCKDIGLNSYYINEGLMSKYDKITLTEEQAIKYGIIK